MVRNKYIRMGIDRAMSASTDINGMKSLLFIPFVLLLLTASGFHTCYVHSDIDEHCRPGSFDAPFSSFQRSVEGFGYFDYEAMNGTLDRLNMEYPGLVDVTTAQESYGLPDCRDGYKVHIVRITNEATLTPQRPEVLFLGGIHGDEPVSVSAAVYLAKFLVEGYEGDEYLRFLLDNREIYIMPCLNPYGLEHATRQDGRGEDMNRDFSYDNDGVPFTSTGARAVHELMREHLFISAVNWHSGTEAIGYAWGAESRETDSDESPDDSAFYSQAMGMRAYAGDFSGHYRTGRNNQVIYHARGAFSDYAYAATWDSEFSDPAWPTGGCRSLAYTVEISGSKRPSTEMLGTDEELYVPGGTGDGYVTKNIRLALYMIDTASPYVHFPEDTPRELHGNAGENLSLEWVVGGCEMVDSCEIVITDPDNAGEKVVRTFDAPPVMTSWEGMENGGNPLTLKRFSANFRVPNASRDYTVTVRVVTDGHILEQAEPLPAILPRSVYARMRTEDGTVFHNGVGSLQCNRNISSPSLILSVNGTVELLHLPSHANRGESIDVTWRANIPGTVEQTYLLWGDEDRPEDADVRVDGSPAAGGGYGAVIRLPDRWASFRLTAVAENGTGSLFRSEEARVMSWPLIELLSVPRDAVRSGSAEIEWRVGGAGSVDEMYLYSSLSDDLWNETEAAILPLNGSGMNGTIVLKMPDSTGTLFVGVKGRVDGEPQLFHSKVYSIQLIERVSFGGANIGYRGGFEQLLDVGNVGIRLAGDTASFLGPDEVTEVTYGIMNGMNGSVELAGELEFLAETGKWRAEGINISGLPEGEYHVRLSVRHGTRLFASPPSDEYLLAVDHVCAARNFSHSLRDDLTLIIALSVHSSYLGWDGRLSDTIDGNLLELRDEMSDVYLSYSDIHISREPDTFAYRALVNLTGTRPGDYRLSLRLFTEMDAMSIECRENILNIPVPFTPIVVLDGLDYRGEFDQNLSITTVIASFSGERQEQSYGSYAPYLTDVEITLELGTVRFNRSYTWQIGPNASSSYLEGIRLELDDFPSGELHIVSRCRYVFLFTRGGPFAIWSNVTHNISINIEHLYWFDGLPDVRMETEEYRGTLSRRMNIAGICINSTSDYPLANVASVRGWILRGTDIVLSFEPVYDEENGYWVLRDLDISNLSDGQYTMIMIGSVGIIAFHGPGSPSTPFTIEIGGREETTSHAHGWIWAGVVLVAILVILLLVGILVVIRRNKGAEVELEVDVDVDVDEQDHR